MHSADPVVAHSDDIVTVMDTTCEVCGTPLLGDETGACASCLEDYQIDVGATRSSPPQPARTTGTRDKDVDELLLDEPEEELDELEPVETMAGYDRYYHESFSFDKFIDDTLLKEQRAQKRDVSPGEMPIRDRANARRPKPAERMLVGRRTSK